MRVILAEDPSLARFYVDQAYLGARGAKVASRYWAELEAELGGEARTLVMSSEALANGAPDGIARLVHMAEAAGREVNVYGLVRGPISQFSSALQQRVRMNLPLEAEYLVPEYRSKLEPWAKLVAPERMVIEDFDALVSQGRSPVQQFFALAGLDAYETPEVRRNAALNVEAMKLLALLNARDPLAKLSAEDKRKRLQLIKLLRAEIAGPKLRAPVAMMRYTSALEADLAWLAENYDIDYRPEMDAARAQMVGVSVEELLGAPSEATLARLGALAERAGATATDPSDAIQALFQAQEGRQETPEPAPHFAQRLLGKLTRVRRRS